MCFLRMYVFGMKLQLQRAFSLVELSIVLVILGLLVGGVLSGQSLIRASELRAITTQSQQYVIIAHTFREKYMSLPGDMNNATLFWGKDATYCNGDSGTATASGTCNGNGDGIMNAATAANTTSERFQFWKHLALAGIINGSFTGIAGPGSTIHSVIGTNVPSARISNTGWSISYWTNIGADPDTFAGSYNANIILFGTLRANQGTFDPALKPEEAYNIDTKVDDGRPAYGRIQGRYWNNLCSSPNSGAVVNTNLDASYRLSDSAIRCALHFVQPY